MSEAYVSNLTEGYFKNNIIYCHTVSVLMNAIATQNNLHLISRTSIIIYFIFPNNKTDIYMIFTHSLPYSICAQFVREVASWRFYENFKLNNTHDQTSNRNILFICEMFKRSTQKVL